MELAHRPRPQRPRRRPPQKRRYLAFLDRFTRQAEIAPATFSTTATDPLDELLQAELASLPSDERELIELKYLGSHSVREIASRLATTEKAVESRLTRIRRTLRDALLDKLKHERPL